MKAGWACLSLLFFVSSPSAEEATETLQVSGYAKGMLIDSSTVVGPQERYTAGLNRLRVELKGDLAKWLVVDLQVDNELTLGDYLRTEQFRLQRDSPPTWWRARTSWLDEPDAYGQARVYRASLTASFVDTDLRVGKQRIAWGTGRFWSPLDILNPVSPTTLERAERVGVDALLVEHKIDALSRAAVVHAPQRDAGDASTAMMWHANRSAVDYSLVAGRFGRSRVLGGDVAGQVGQSGIRAELTRTLPDAGPAYVRALVGLDHAFANTLSVSGELFFDGSGSRDRARYDFAALFSGARQNLARHYLGLSASYDVTPLIETRHDLVLNLDDGSGCYSQALTWSLRTNLDATLGAQFFGGARTTEFRAFKRLLYLQLQWFY
ncbi:MAG TPA: hypothetical protein VFY73_13920 [Ideonella sp.]|uniref:hypothetical protein n=1 Tax=Ideonella sp. TaxID=1929293 RepID=UPI002E373A5C|nr:hypothetical protein [Ideonella sp.]HEX5685115.1 hypothetical protein [Ideonella sp.]